MQGGRLWQLCRRRVLLLRIAKRQRFWHVDKFALDAEFSDLIVEGDNSNVMRSIILAQPDWSRLGNLYDDIRCLGGQMQHVEFQDISRTTNSVAHSLARFARHLSEDIIWLEDSHPPTLEALYLDSISIAN